MSASGSNVIYAVSRALKTIIQQGISEGSSTLPVSFDSPSTIEKSGDSQVLVYLYQIQRNPWLANLQESYTQPKQVEKQAAPIVIHAPPSVVDLSYMIVPYAKSGEKELQLLEQLTQVMLTAQSINNCEGMSALSSECSDIANNQESKTEENKSNRVTELAQPHTALQTHMSNSVPGMTSWKKTLQDSDNANVKIIPEPHSIDLLHKLWACFPKQELKATLLFRLTPVKLPDLTTTTAYPVNGINNLYIHPRPQKESSL